MKKSWGADAEFWNSMPRRSVFASLAVAFCLFGSFGFILDSTETRASTPLSMTLNVVVRGCFGSAWALFGLRRMFKSMIPLLAVQLGIMWWLQSSYRELPALAANSPALRIKIDIDAGGAMALIIAGYACFAMLFRWEGRRYFAVHAEMRLAGEIHRSLVPDISRSMDGFEIYGLSAPSGQVGGDLLDVVGTKGGWFAYVADVSGHGVSAGVLMSMTKTATRMRLECAAEDAEVLADLNRVLKPLTAPNMFITFAWVSWMGNGGLRFALAGHLPLLHFRRSLHRVDEAGMENLPLCIFPDQRFVSQTLPFEDGDVLAIITDGVTEVFDARDHEFGLDPLKSILLSRHDAELKDILAEMRARALAHGRQTDDQTILLIRRIANNLAPDA